ncbi:MAG: TIGR01212 family radical SAM protein [Desulfobacterales bacterium]|nr:TIGR01212 family radical SAM protein [Desulfobacterales bacterium]
MKSGIPKQRYNDFNTYLRGLFGCRVQKITVDAGLDCPNRDGHISSGGCIYCNLQGSGTGAYRKGISITDQIERVKKPLIRRYKAKKFLVYFQAYSNTYAPVKHLKALYDEALGVKNIVGLSIGTRPDCIDEEKISLIESYTEDFLIWVEYGLQSIHNKTLKKINRGHDYNCFEKAVKATQNRGINICTHVILGLPGETRKDMLETAKRVASLGIDGIKLHLLYVIKGTALEALYNHGKFHCLEMKEYTDLVCDFLEILPKEMIVQRLKSDPHQEELVAPMWAMDRNGTMNLIRGTLEERKSFQGKCFL